MMNYDVIFSSGEPHESVWSHNNLKVTIPWNTFGMNYVGYPVYHDLDLGNSTIFHLLCWPPVGSRCTML